VRSPGLPTLYVMRSATLQMTGLSPIRAAASILSTSVQVELDEVVAETEAEWVRIDEVYAHSGPDP